MTSSPHAPNSVSALSSNGLPTADFWRGRRVLLTGHTGFKGSWLALWLAQLGARVTGLALEPEGRALFNLARVSDCLTHRICDLRDHTAVATVVRDARPEIVLHLAAQPIVRTSVAEPSATIASNVLGTAHLLDVLRLSDDVRTILVVTSDKVYANDGRGKAFIESDRLGGKDPYSASKAAAEIITASFRDTYFQHRNVAIATARGGNVIGGGDFSIDRIIPDCVRAVEARAPLILRYPQSTRPWQHVLDCLTGYLIFAEALHTRSNVSMALNFGPDARDAITVGDVAQTVLSALQHGAGWRHEPPAVHVEAALLALDPTQAKSELGWRERLPGMKAIAATADWYAAWRTGTDPRTLTQRQIETFIDTAGAP